MFEYLNVTMFFGMNYYYINLISNTYSTLIVLYETINQKCYVNKIYLY